MNKRVKFLAAALVCCNLVTTTALADDLSDAKEKSESIQSQIKSDKEKVEELNKNREVLLSDMDALDKELDTVYGQINELNSQISQSNKKIEELETREVELQNALESDKEVMGKRYRALYKSNGVGYLELLIESDSFGDFLQRLDTVVVMANHNNDVIAEYGKLQQELTANIKESNDEKAILEESKKTLDVNLADIENKKAAKKDLMRQAEEDLDEAEKLLAANEAEFDQVLASIKSLEEEATRPSRGNGSTSTGSESTGSTTVSKDGMYSITGTRYSITSPYGPRYSPISGKSEFHNGIDIGAPYGAPVYSLKDGVVTYSGVMSGYGNVVVVNHGDISTLYAHNSSLSVSVGQTVSGGQQIANVGATGWATGPHIHFEVIIDGSRVDSAPYYF